MNQSNRSELRKFSSALGGYRSIAERYKHRLDEEPALTKPLNFWFESARFLISELEFWDEEGDSTKFEEAEIRLQKALKNIDQLITQLLEKDRERHPG